MGIFDKIFGTKKKNSEINFNQIGLNLSENGKESIRKFISRTDNERMGDIMLLGDKGDQNFFYLIYYSALFDSDINVRFAALKRIPNFQGNPNFEKLINKLEEPNIGGILEPYYSMMLFRLGKISETELNNKLNNGQEQKVNQKPLKTVEEARIFIQENFSSKEETLLISDELNDSMGMKMAIIGHGILNVGYMPDGFDQKEGYRIYKYNKK